MNRVITSNPELTGGYPLHRDRGGRLQLKCLAWLERKGLVLGDDHQAPEAHKRFKPNRLSLGQDFTPWGTLTPDRQVAGVCVCIPDLPDVGVGGGSSPPREIEGDFIFSKRWEVSKSG